MLTNIFFVRHAHSIYTPDELNRPLSERGFKEAAKVTRILSKENVTHVVSSPCKRAIQTVEGTANLFELHISIDDSFNERKLAGSSVDNFDEIIVKYWQNHDFSLPGGESGRIAQNRGVKALKGILSNYEGGKIVIGTHGNIMALIMNYFDKKYNYAFWHSLNMPDIYKMSFENGILTGAEQIWE